MKLYLRGTETEGDNVTITVKSAKDRGRIIVREDSDGYVSVKLESLDLSL